MHCKNIQVENPFLVKEKRCALRNNVYFFFIFRYSFVGDDFDFFVCVFFWWSFMFSLWFCLLAFFVCLFPFVLFLSFLSCFVCEQVHSEF